MNATSIVCPHCRQAFEISDAIRHQIDDELQKAKTEQSISLRKEYDTMAEAKVKEAVEDALSKARESAMAKINQERQKAKFEIERLNMEREMELDRERETTRLQAEKLLLEAKASKENETRLREEHKKLLDELMEANKAREDAELKARKELREKERLIREEAAKQAFEDYNTKIREQEETISRLREQLTTAKLVAEQGSQQLQGEILELDVEQSLRQAFPYDVIEEVKKGERGSDIRQTVNEQFYSNCGLILWECKNAKTFQAQWIAKLKDEMAENKAQMGIIVFNKTEGESEDFKQLAEGIWLVKPRYVVMLATLLREVCIKVFIANRNAEGKDIKIEMMYSYLTGGEFSNRIRYIIESYEEMKKQLDMEKKQAQKRWAAQEKILSKVTGSLYGMSGDLQGIAGQEIIALSPMLEDEAPDDDEQA